MDIPEGFEPFRLDSPFVSLIGPLLVRRDERGVVLGLRVRPDHLNVGGTLHGGVAATVADVALGRNVAAGAPGRRFVTASLTVDFVATAAVGEWVQAEASITRAGRRAAFGRALLSAADRPIAQATGVFMYVGDAR